MVRAPAMLRGLLLGGAAVMLSALGAEGQPTEYELKATFLYNFAKYVDWPASSGEPRATLDLCILGRDPFGQVLDETVRDETVRGRHLAVRRLDDVAATADCDVLFISSSEQSSLEHILDAVDERSVLTVGEMERFAERGGIIHLLKDGNRVRLEINVGAAEDAGLKISSQLLKLGRIVESGGG